MSIIGCPDPLTSSSSSWDISESQVIVQSDAIYGHQLSPVSTIDIRPLSSIANINDSVNGELIAVTHPVEDLPPIRLIDFNLFKQLGHTPRYPDNKDLCVNLGDIDRRRSLIVFISHCWLRGYDGAPGWEGKPHPDNPVGDKFKLCVKGIESVWKTHAPGMDRCYMWMDFGCMDQDGNPAGELKRLDEIIKCADFIFTPIAGDPANLPSPHSHLYKDYKAPLWNEGQYSYLFRSWCRIEMFFAANIPVNIDTDRLGCFRAGLRHHASNGVRPHMLYGTREFNGNVYPHVLPPLQNSYFESFHPLRGSLSVESDRVKMSELVAQLAPYMKSVNEGYQGDMLNDKKHGRGIFRFASGDTYEGDYQNDKQHGKGVYRYADGSTYEGDYQDGKKHGRGMFRFVSGSTYEGDWKDDNMHGKGIYRYVDRDIYEGDWKDDNMHGKGIFRYADGGTYEGDWRDDDIHGRGSMSWSNGSCFDGSFDSNNMRSGVLRSVAHGQGASLNDSPCEYRAEFTGGDDIVNEFRMYRVKLYTIPDGELFKDCSFSNGQLIE